MKEGYVAQTQGAALLVTSESDICH